MRSIEEETALGTDGCRTLGRGQHFSAVNPRCGGGLLQRVPLLRWRLKRACERKPVEVTSKGTCHLRRWVLQTQPQ